MKEIKADDLLCFENFDIGSVTSGSFGKVYVGQHESLDLVVLKCFDLAKCGKKAENVAEKFFNEVDLLCGLKHRNLVSIHGWTKSNNKIATVMDYFPVGNLNNFLLNIVKDQTQLAPVLRLRMGSEISCGLSFVQSAVGKVEDVYRSCLQPKDIFLTRELHCKVRLGNLGLASCISSLSPGQASDHYQSLKSEEWQAYVAPEKLNNCKVPVSKQQITYSFAMLLHMLLSCERPFFNNEFAYTESVKRGNRPDTNAIKKLKIQVVNKDMRIVAAIEKIMIRCWHQQPSKRPNIKDVKDELCEMLTQQDQGGVLLNVVDIMKTVHISTPDKDEHHLVPISVVCARKGFGTTSGEVPESDNTREEGLRALKDTFNKRANNVKQVLSSAEAVPSSRTCAEDHGATDPLRRISPLVQEYCGHMREGDFSEARKCEATVTTLVIGQAVVDKHEAEAYGANEEDFQAVDQFGCLAAIVESTGDEFRNKQRVFEATLLYGIAASLWEKTTDPNRSASGMKKCVWKLGLAVSETLSQNVQLRPVIAGHVIPAMCEIKNKIRVRAGVDESHRSLQLEYCSYYVNVSEHLVGSWNTGLMQKCTIL